MNFHWIFKWNYSLWTIKNIKSTLALRERIRDQIQNGYSRRFGSRRHSIRSVWERYRRERWQVSSWWSRTAIHLQALHVRTEVDGGVLQHNRCRDTCHWLTQSHSVTHSVTVSDQKSKMNSSSSSPARELDSMDWYVDYGNTRRSFHYGFWFRHPSNSSVDTAAVGIHTTQAHATPPPSTPYHFIRWAEKQNVNTTLDLILGRGTVIYFSSTANRKLLTNSRSRWGPQWRRW